MATSPENGDKISDIRENELESTQNPKPRKLKPLLDVADMQSESPRSTGGDTVNSADEGIQDERKRRKKAKKAKKLKASKVAPEDIDENPNDKSVHPDDLIARVKTENTDRNTNQENNQSSNPDPLIKPTTSKKSPVDQELYANPEPTPNPLNSVVVFGDKKGKGGPSYDQDDPSYNPPTSGKVNSGESSRKGKKSTKDSKPIKSTVTKQSPGTSNQNDSDDSPPSKHVKFKTSENVESSSDPAYGYQWGEPAKDLPLYTLRRCFHDWQGVIKVLFAIFLFCVMSICLIVSKGCLLFISSQMNPYVDFSQYDIRDYTHNITQCSVPLCKHSDQVKGGVCAPVESVRWIWSMFMIQCVPYLLIFCRCVWKMCFKQKKWPSVGIFFAVFVIESLYTIGMFMFLYIVLPSLDVSRGLFLMSGIALIPSLCNLFNTGRWRRWHEVLLDILAFGLQATATMVWIIRAAHKPVDFNADPDVDSEVSIQDVCKYNFTHHGSDYMYMESRISNGSEESTTLQAVALAPTPYVWPLPMGFRLPETAEQLWALPVSLILISIGYWENFVDKDISTNRHLRMFLEGVKRKHMQGHTKIYLFISLWKILLTFICIIIYHASSSYNPITLKVLLNPVHFYDNAKTCGGYDSSSFEAFHSDWLEVGVIQIFMGIICFCVSDMAIQSRLQIQSFTLPLVLSTPFTYLLFVWACHSCNDAWKFTIHEDWNILSDGAWTFYHQLWDINENYYWNCYSGYENYEDLFTDRFIPWAFFWWLAFLWITRYLWTPKIERLAKIDTMFTLSPPCGCLLEQSLMLTRRRDDEELQDRERRAADAEKQFTRKSIDTMRPSEGHIPTMTAEKFGTPFMYLCATMWHETQQEMVSVIKSIFRMNIDQCARYNAKHVYNFKEPDYYEFEVHVFFDDAFTPHSAMSKDFTINKFVKTFVQSVSKAASDVYNVNVLMDPPTKYKTPYGGRLEWELPLGKNKMIVHLKDKEKIRNKKRWSQVMYMNALIGRGIVSQEMEERTRMYVARNTYILALDGDVDFQPESVLHLLDLMKRDEKVAAACGRIHPTGSGPMVWYQKFEYSLSHWFQKSTEHVLGCVLCSPGCFSLFRSSALMDVVGQYSEQAKSPIQIVQYDQGEDRWLCTLLIQNGHRIEYSAAADAYTNAPEDFNEFFNQRRRWITSTYANIIELLMHGRSTAKKNENMSLVYMAYQGLLFLASVLGPGTIYLLICGSFQVVWGIKTFLSAAIGVIPFILFIVINFFTKKHTQLHYALLLSGVLAVVQMIVLAGVLRTAIVEGICALPTIFLLFVVGSFILASILHPMEFPNLFYMLFFYLCIPSTYIVLIIYAMCNLHETAWGTRECNTDNSQKKSGWLNKYFNIESNGVFNDDGDEEQGGCCSSCFSTCCAKNGNVVTPEYTVEDQDSEAADEEEEANPQSTDGHRTNMEEGTRPRRRWRDAKVIVKGPTRIISSAEKTYWEQLIEKVLYPIEWFTSTAEQFKIRKGLKDLRNKAVAAFFMINLLYVVFILSLEMSIENSSGDGVRVDYTCGGRSYSIDPISMTFIFVFGSVMVIQLLGMMAHRVFTFLQIVSTIVLCRSEKEQTDLDDENVLPKDRGYTFAKEMNRVDLDEDSDADDMGSVTSLGDSVHHKAGRGNKPRKSLRPDEMRRIVDARNLALHGKVGNTPEEWRMSMSQTRSERRASLYQPVVQMMHERKSVTITTETRIQPDSQEVKTQRKIIDTKILTATK